MLARLVGEVVLPQQRRDEADAPVAATCHGPLLLAAAGVLQGRTSSAYPELAIDVEAAGGVFENGGGVVDGKLVTARAWPDNGTWMKAFLEVLEAAGVRADGELAAVSVS